MQTIQFGSTYADIEVAILIKSTAFNRAEILNNYIDPLCPDTTYHSHFMAVSLAYQPNGKAPTSLQKEHIKSVLDFVGKTRAKLLIVADAPYFKTLTKNTKVDPHYGYICDCMIDGYKDLKIVLAPNFRAILYNPAMKEKMQIAIDTVKNYMGANYTDPGKDIIHSADYPRLVSDIESNLQRLRRCKGLTCDIETRGLEFWNAGLSTITFCENKHNGIAFPIDRGDCCVETKALLKKFFEEYDGNLIYHNAGYDLKILVYELWMKDLSDYDGMLEGIEVLTRNFDDTKIITYLATNNTVENVLKLKSLAQEYAGNYALDGITDTTKIPINKLLEYNLIDGLCTWYIHEKYWGKMVNDSQLEIYETLFIPAIKSILQMELTGMPISPAKVLKAKTELETIVNKHTQFLINDPLIKEFEYQQKLALMAKKTAEAKVKVYEIDDPIIARHQFNPGSGPQLQEFLYTFLGYPIIDKTKTKKAATGAKTLDKLINHSKNADHKAIFENLIGLGKADIILSTFIPAFENAQQIPDGSWRLYGNFNLGGTQSGRLSSSNPNLQNIPSGSTYAQIIKECFVSPPGWIFVGADFTALEAITNALITKDPNKIKVYTDGYDSHCLNAYAYFKSQLPDIVDTVVSINSIKIKYKVLRTKSKAPTFALQYEGTPETLMRSLGIHRAEAQTIYNNFHTLYVVSDEWADALIEQATMDGYITCAFGLRLRTPVLEQTVLGTSATPYKAQAERRSGLNAKTQSYCMLTTRSGNEFQEIILASKYRTDILPCAQIHDALYYLVRDKPEIVQYVNNNLISCMQWQNLPELKHPIVKNGAELDIFWPTWQDGLTIPNDISITEILTRCKLHKIEVKS